MFNNIKTFFSLKNIFIYIMFLLILSIDTVYASSNIKYETYCSDGFFYYVSFDKDSGLTAVDLYEAKAKLYPTFGSEFRDATLNGKKYKYISAGTYNDNGNSKSTQRCYSVYSVEKNGNDEKITVSSKSCNAKYSTQDLKFVIQNEEDINDAVHGKYKNYKELKIDTNTGLVTLKLKLDTNADSGKALKNAWDRLNVTTSYTAGSKGTVTKNNDYTITISGISPAGLYSDNATYKISLYLDKIKKDDFIIESEATTEAINMCGGANGGIYLGTTSIAIVSESVVKIKNPIKDEQVCKDVRNFTTAKEAIRKNYINECYDDYIYEYQKETLRETVTEKYETLKKMYSGAKSVKELADTNKYPSLLCTDTELGIPSVDAESKPFETKVVYEEVGSYFGMICVENYYVAGGNPSLVQPGMGFDYNNQVEIKKSCSIFQVGRIVKPPSCNISVSSSICVPSDDDQTWRGGENGGPSTKFDQCVLDCDGGSYSQKCINSCYQKEYNPNYNEELISNYKLPTSNFLEKYNIIKIDEETDEKIKNVVNSGDWAINFTGSNLTHSETGIEVVYEPNVFYEGFNKFGKVTVKKDGAVLLNFGYSAYCLNHSNPCYIAISKGPVGCSDNPNAAVASMKSAADAELRKYEGIAESIPYIENYSMSFIDSYNENVYKISGSSHDDTNKPDSPRLVIKKREKTQNDKGERTVNVEYDLGEGQKIKGLASKAFNTIYDINLPVTHTNVGDGFTIAIRNNWNNDKYYVFDGTTKDDKGIDYYKFRSAKFDKAYLSPGRQFYYTNVDSQDINVNKQLGDLSEHYNNIGIANAVLTFNDVSYTYSLHNLYKNIRVDFKIGDESKDNSVSFSDAGLYCYYGVYLGDPDDDDEIICESCPTSTPVPTKTPGVGGEDPDPIIPTPTGGGGENKGIRYYYREIDLNDVFPNNRNPRWNWTGTITANGDGTSKVTGAANNDDSGYIVDPTRLIYDIESKGESIYTTISEEDYAYTLTPSLISVIRNYNKSRIGGRKITYLDYSLSSQNSTRAYSEKIKEWLPDLNTTSITDCNNSINNGCDSTVGGK